MRNKIFGDIRILWSGAFLFRRFTSGALSGGSYAYQSGQSFVVICKALIFVVASVAVATAEPPKVVNPATIKVKVSFKPDDEFAIEFNRDGDLLTNPLKSNKAEGKKLSVKVKLGVTSDSPIRPPREGATRPFLSVENNFDKTLHFRAIVRLNGSKEFVEIAEDMELLSPGKTFNKCWGFDSQVEEVVLYEFKLSSKQVE